MRQGDARAALCERAGMSAARTRLAVFAVLLVAIGLRIAGFRTFTVHHPDEAYQYLEQAHRLAFGPGIVPWEYRLGMRSWLVPLLLAGPMKLGEMLAPATTLYLVLPRLLVAVLALAPLWAAYTMGRRASVRHGLVAMAVFAMWYESVYFGVHVLTEVLSVAAFLPASALLTGERTPRGTLAGGALLALAVVLRFQYGPAAAVFAAIAIGGDWRTWRLVVLGGAAMLVVSAGFDVAMGQAPFGWLIENVRQNFFAGRSAEFGTDGPLLYLSQLGWHWWLALVPIALLLPAAARRHPALFWSAVANIAVHSVIGHKEYRFIWLSVAILIILAAIESWTLVEARERRKGAAAVALVGVWAATSAGLAVAAPASFDWDQLSAGMALAHDAGRDARLCGLAIDQVPYWATGGYAFVHRNVPLYAPWQADVPVTRFTQAYNAIIAPKGAALPVGYLVRSCREDRARNLCLAVRAGGCDPSGVAGVTVQATIEAKRL